MNDHPESLWEWSLAAYGKPGVETAALRLQDDYGLDVNICLWCVWSARNFEPLRDIHFRKAVDLTGPIRCNVIEPLRAARRFLKTFLPGEELREAIKRDELAAEKLAQDLLENFANEHLDARLAHDWPSNARRNLSTYASFAQAARKTGFTVSLLESFLNPIVVFEPEQTPQDSQ